MEMLKRYFALQAEIFAYFGYVENWRVIPLDDQTDKHWMLFQEEDGSGQVAYSPDPFTAESVEAGTNTYSAIIYRQRFLPKWVCRAADFTMVSADTRTDDNKFLMVFANAMECTDKELKAVFQDHWG